jgi:hypothetical protein
MRLLVSMLPKLMLLLLLEGYQELSRNDRDDWVVLDDSQSSISGSVLRPPAGTHGDLRRACKCRHDNIVLARSYIAWTVNKQYTKWS